MSTSLMEDRQGYSLGSIVQWLPEILADVSRLACVASEPISG